MSLIIIIPKFQLPACGQTKILPPVGYRIDFSAGAEGFFNETDVSAALSNYYPVQGDLVPIRFGVTGSVDLSTVQISFQYSGLNTAGAVITSNNQYFNRKLKGHHFGVGVAEDLFKSERHDLLPFVEINSILLNLQVSSGNISNSPTQIFTSSRFLNLFQQSLHSSFGLKYSYNMRIGQKHFVGFGIAAYGMYLFDDPRKNYPGWTQNGLSGPPVDLPIFSGKGFGLVWSIAFINRFKMD